MQPYNANDDMLRATTMEIISTLKELLHLHPLYNEQMRNFIQVGLSILSIDSVVSTGLLYCLGWMAG